MNSDLPTTREGGPAPATSRTSPLAPYNGIEHLIDVGPGELSSSRAGETNSPPLGSHTPRLKRSASEGPAAASERGLPDVKGVITPRATLGACHCDSLESDEMWESDEPESEPEEEELVWGNNTFSVPALSRQFSRMGGDFELEHSTPR